MKKFICICLTVVFLITLCACGKGEPVEEIIIDETTTNVTSTPSEPSDTNSQDEQTSSQDDASDESNSSQDNVSNEPTSSDDTSSSQNPSDCIHNHSEQIVKAAKLFEAGEKKYTCDRCGDNFTKTYPIEKIKILTIGNSYSLNSMWNLYDICKSAGVKEIDIAIMYIGGCSLDQHWENVQNNSATYQLYRNNSGEWKITDNYSIETIISEQAWDVITLQNSSYWSGNSQGFSNLDNMANYVGSKCPNAKILWHLTWPYQKGSEWLTPESYNGDEMVMYNSIIECVKSQVVPNNKIHSVVPVGTAVMNARTSRLKTQVHQSDGSHLSENVGYYVGALTWFMHLTGQDPYDFNYTILNSEINQNKDVFIESAQNAIKNPYQITQSYYTN